jgi:hypothetical protein
LLPEHGAAHRCVEEYIGCIGGGSGGQHANAIRGGRQKIMPGLRPFAANTPTILTPVYNRGSDVKSSRSGKADTVG